MALDVAAWRARHGKIAGDEAALTACVAAAHAAWPDLVLADETYVTALADKANGPASLAHLHTNDLFLTTACMAGCVDALIAFDRYLTEVRPSLRRIDQSAAFADEVLQLVRETLFVWVGELSPRIADYAGAGPLGGWVRVMVTRIATNQRRDRAASPRDALRDLPGSDAAAGPGYLTSRHRDAFQAALDTWIAGLAPAERTLLRRHFVDGLGLDTLAADDQLPPATLARRLDELRGRLSLATHDELHRRLGIAGKERDSMVVLLQSQLQLALPRLLGSATEKMSEIEGASSN